MNHALHVKLTLKRHCTTLKSIYQHQVKIENACWDIASPYKKQRQRYKEHIIKCGVVLIFKFPLSIHRAELHPLDLSNTHFKFFHVFDFLMRLTNIEKQRIQIGNEGHTRRVRSRLSVVAPPTARHRWPKFLMDDALEILAIVLSCCHSPHLIEPETLFCGHKHKLANYCIPDPPLPLPLRPQKHLHAIKFIPREPQHNPTIKFLSQNLYTNLLSPPMFTIVQQLQPQEVGMSYTTSMYIYT